ncbi:hypothetical protein B0T10DRAFT_602693 [Thelonectria olida]|uniref:Uncharacterized protein n=1 Tax=Thelonectria olida TaxID=1576542 RepID=A0A9P8WIA1_9HYPO|nr:hypothetical protein B0T10DRAFT_602693 [Thelonectria olida]
MYSLAVLSVLAALSTAQQLNYADPTIPCGGDNPPCPADTYCVPDAADCAGDCLGVCVFRNTYQHCGGFTVEPNLCDSDDHHCVDDPRNPESCGMACDAPGICVDPNLKKCQCNKDCPEGLWCYAWDKGCTGKNCKKVCL